MALSFLTILPARQVAYLPGALGRAAAWFTTIGLLVGLLAAGAHWLLGQWLPPFVTGALTVTIWAACTGFLHLDGLADCCDGLLAAASPERRLEIMRDPRSGAFAVAGLTLFLLAKVAAVAALRPGSSALILAAVWARWTLLITARQPMARPSGLGADFAASLTRSTLAQAAVVPLILAVIWPGWQLLLGLCLAHLATLALITAARSRLGGVTGDIYGATVELSELALLLAFTAAV